ncbi:ASCH domain-containing protein [Xenorhabdus sp. Reich]|uniref:ASCH domain-containing protein n=2 Tax=Xenorhabdus littoralis TaxID=2582835 RepID=A0ABU4SIN8_9GAMM|nr:ASCH domain-containing protein [Xenorhabdus sp. Reich]
MESIENKYPKAGRWVFGDSPEMNDELAELVVKGVKTATTCSFDSYCTYGPEIISSHNVVFDSQDNPICVIRIMTMHLMKFSEMTEELAWKEGEGDRSLHNWQLDHQSFFTREGNFSPDMEMVVFEFKVIEKL